MTGSGALSLVYTKTASTQAPITHTYVGVAPCLDPGQLIKEEGIRTKSYEYPLERIPDTCNSLVDDHPD